MLSFVASILISTFFDVQHRGRMYSLIVSIFSAIYRNWPVFDNSRGIAIKL